MGNDIKGSEGEMRSYCDANPQCSGYDYPVHGTVDENGAAYDGHACQEMRDGDGDESEEGWKTCTKTTPGNN